MRLRMVWTTFDTLQDWDSSRPPLINQLLCKLVAAITAAEEASFSVFSRTFSADSRNRWDSCTPQDMLVLRFPKSRRCLGQSHPAYTLSLLAFYLEIPDIVEYLRRSMWRIQCSMNLDRRWDTALSSSRLGSRASGPRANHWRSHKCLYRFHQPCNLPLSA